MQPLLKRQTELLSRLDTNAKQDKLIQTTQLHKATRIDDDGDRMENQLKDLNKNVKSLNEKTGDGLNSNVIRLFKEMEKVGKVVSSRAMTSEEAGKITTKVGERRQFNTIKPRVDNFKEGFKDLFTMRGFLDKTGIVKRGSGGLISEYLDRGEAKKKYVNQRMKTKGTTFGSAETFAKQFDEQQRIQSDINKNEKEIKGLRDSGATDIGLKRSGLLDKRDSLATDMAKVDPSVRPEGFDPRTGKIKVKPKDDTEQGVKKSADILSFPGGGNKESMLEQNRMVAEQTGLLIQIEENTRPKDSRESSNKKPDKKPTAAEEGGGFGVADMLGGSGRMGKIAKGAGKGLMSGAKTAGSFLMKRAGPVAALAAVGTGAYQAYQGYQSAGDKEQSALEGIDAKVASGELTEEQAKGLRVGSRETATVDKSKAVGGGAGTAAGGVAGALKGAAVGAAIGSAVPIVGTVIGGAVGAGLGAVGGSFLGGKSGEYLGEKFGQAKNFLSKKSGESTRGKTGKSSSVDIQFSEAQFSQSDPENYAKFVKDRDELTKKYAAESAKRFNKKEPSQTDFRIAKARAQTETIQKYRKEIEAAGAGKVTGGIKETPVEPGDKTTGALKKTAEGVTPKAGVTPKVGAANQSDMSGEPTQEKFKQIFDAEMEKHGNFNLAQAKAKQATGLFGTGRSPETLPKSTGNIISKQSGDNEQAKLDSNKGNDGNNTNIVNAPVTTNNKSSPIIKSPIRNQESSVSSYLRSRYVT
jgi:hypothetical protein